MGSRKVRWIGAGVTTVLVLLGLWVAWQVWQVQRDLNDAIDHGKAIQRAVEDGDTEALNKELAALRNSSHAASDRTDGITWSVLTRAPIWGDDAAGVETASRVLANLADNGVEPLATATDQFDKLLPKDGRIDTAQVAALAGPVAKADAAFAKADKELASVDSSVFIGRLEKQFNNFRNQVSKGADGLDSARVATEILPAMLGDDGPRTYLLAFQNNAELRATGGLPGAVSYLRAKDGKISIVRQLSGGDFGLADSPVLPLSEAELALYDEQLGTYFVDAGMGPDLARAADLMRAHSQRKFPQLPVDGVLTVDTVAMAYVLEVTGPITVDGVRLTGENLVDELLHKAYLRLDGDGQDAFFAKVASAAFAKLTSGSGDPFAMIKSLARASNERRIFVRSFDESEQERLAGSEIAGDWVIDPEVERPQVAFTVNDTTGSKMSYFLRYDVDVHATSCVNQVQGFTAKARLRSTAPRDAAKKLPDYITGGGNYGVPPGSQLVTVRIYGPAGGKVGKFEINGAPQELVHVEQDGRPVGMTFLELAPGQTLDIAWTMKSGKGQTKDADVTITPSIQHRDNAMSVGSACK